MIKIFKFVAIGGAATLLQYLLLWCFVEFNLMNAILASGTSYACSAVFNYLANYHITFASNLNHRETLPKFIVTASVGVALNTALFAAFQLAVKNFAPIHYFLTAYGYLIAQLFATLLTLIVNYLMHKFWIYRR